MVGCVSPIFRLILLFRGLGVKGFDGVFPNFSIFRGGGVGGCIFPKSVFILLVMGLGVVG